MARHPVLGLLHVALRDVAGGFWRCCRAAVTAATAAAAAGAAAGPLRQRRLAWGAAMERDLSGRSSVVHCLADLLTFQHQMLRRGGESSCQKGVNKHTKANEREVCMHASLSSHMSSCSRQLQRLQQHFRSMVHQVSSGSPCNLLHAQLNACMDACTRNLAHLHTCTGKCTRAAIFLYACDVHARACIENAEPITGRERHKIASCS